MSAFSMPKLLWLIMLAEHSWNPHSATRNPQLGAGEARAG